LLAYTARVLKQECEELRWMHLDEEVETDVDCGELSEDIIASLRTLSQKERPAGESL
jgi:hypothetical protein